MGSKCLRVISALILMAILAALPGCAQEPEKSAGINVHFFQFDETDKKWGDCTLFTFPDGSNMLVDCGLKQVGPYLVEDLKEMGVETIDVFVISHFHSDHIGSFQAIVDNFLVKQIYSPGFCPTECRWIEEAIQRNQIPYSCLAAGDVFSVGGVQADVLWPLAELVDEEPSKPWDDTKMVFDTNNRSLVFRMEYQGLSVLMTGDIYKEGQRDILAYYSQDTTVLQADLLKVPHHGYQNAVNETFIQTVSPQYAVMQGNQVMNKVDYKKYAKTGCATYAGWMNGDIDVFLSAEGLSLTAEVPEINDYYV